MSWFGEAHITVVISFDKVSIYAETKQIRSLSLLIVIVTFKFHNSSKGSCECIKFSPRVTVSLSFKFMAET